MRPFNPDRVNSVKNPVHLSGKTELTQLVKEIQCMLMRPPGLHTNKMVTHAGPSAAVRAEEGEGAGVNPTFTMQTIFLSANTGFTLTVTTNQ